MLHVLTSARPDFLADLPELRERNQMRIEKNGNREDRMMPAMERRDFLRSAVVAATAGILIPGELGAFLPSTGRERAMAAARETGLGNAESPALQFQAYPGGTGALLEKLWKEYGGDPFARHTIELEPWTGTVPTGEEEIAFLPAHRLGALIRGGHLSSVELTELYLERLRRYDPLLLFAVSILEGRAREEAQQADTDLRAGTWRGPLHGVPYGIKDLFAVTGTRTAWGSADFEGQVIDMDSEVVVRLRDAGAVLVAKLATGEFALGDQWFRGRTLNPWNPGEGASGSSAGPGSATAAGCVGFAIGTETQGSIVSPARRTGLSALRPTFGRVSRHGGMVLSWSMDKPGPMCRSAEDCAHVFNAIHGSDEKDPSTLTTPFRFEREPDLSEITIGYGDDAPESFLEALSGLGARLRAMPPLPSGNSNAIAVESAAAFEFHVAPHGEPQPVPEGLDAAEERRMTRFTRGRDISGVDYLQSQRQRYRIMQEMAEAMEGFDMYVSGSGDVGLTNTTGHPAVVLPYGFGVRNPGEESPTEMPLTTTLIGNLFADDRLLSVAHLFQSSTDWHRLHPVLEQGDG
ncbi:MAG: amidase [Gemmatimonadales bacterium]|nr:MAG: amidase [Gemmatimonadales bacterium]